MKRQVFILTPSLALVAAAVRLLIVSNYQTTTAVAVAANSGAVSTLLGTLIPVVQLFLPVSVVVMLVASLFTLSAERAYVRKRLWLLSIAALAGTLLITPASESWADIYNELRSIVVVGTSYSWIFWLLAILVGVIAIVSAIVNGEAVHVFFGLMATVFIAFVILVLAAIVSLSILMNYAFPMEPRFSALPTRARAMWLPAEEIKVRSSNEPIVGYVVGTNVGWMTILTDAKRTIVVVRADQVESRNVCRIGEASSMPLVPLPGAEVPQIAVCK